jgi:hypothetical protein
VVVVFIRRQGRTGRLLPAILAIGSTFAVAMPATPASAQVFNFFFGRPRPPAPAVSAYADPHAGSGLFDRFRDQAPARESAGPVGPSVVYCVRLCDGRFFPIQRSRTANAAQLCNSFCPASATKLFSGSKIDHAVASDGSRYASLPNAFVFRERLVDGCTCNGRDAIGLVNAMTAADDPSLRKGDIVATRNGFVAYHGGNRQHAEFTPIESVSGLSSNWRQRLSDTRIVPSNATPVTAAAIRDRRAQLRQQ